jgi:hypothetical protein
MPFSVNAFWAAEIYLMLALWREKLGDTREIYLFWAPRGLIRSYAAD